MFRASPFGLKHLGSHFTRVMNIILGDFPFVKVYIDDIIIHSSDKKGGMARHFDYVKRVIEHLTTAKMILNPEKCYFGKKAVYLLEYCVSEKGKSLDPRKVTNISEWPLPQTGKEMQRALGVINYFRDHIPLAAQLMAPLDALRNIGDRTKIQWTPRLTENFESLKKILASNVVLSSPDPKYPFLLATDASNYAIGAVLFQQYDEVDSTGKGKITHIKYIGFMARSLSSSEKNWSTTCRELCAVVFGIAKFHKFLYGRHFTLLTDHRSLTYIFTQNPINTHFVSWFDTLLNYDFDVIHIPGIQNVLPDALSRLFPSEQDLIEEEQVKVYKKTAHKPNKKRKIPKKVFYVQSASKFSSKDYVIPPETERQGLLADAHEFGHFGADHIVRHLHNQNVSWTNILADAVEFVRKCPTCQKFNIVKKGYHPHRPVYAYIPGDGYAMDLADPFGSSSNEYTYLLVVVDICTRFCILRPIKDKTAKSVATALIDIFSILELPRHFVISDNGTEFKNEITKMLFDAFGVERRFSTPYHPAGNGTAERFVQSAKRTIEKVLGGASEDWHLYVPVAQLMINNEISTRTLSTPFSLMFARNVNEPITFRNKEGKIEKSEYMSQDELLKRIDYMSQIVFPVIAERTKQHLDQLTENIDKKRVQADFPEGSHVMVKVHNRHNSLSPAYEGPYIIERKTAGGTYSSYKKWWNLSDLGSFSVGVRSHASITIQNIEQCRCSRMLLFHAPNSNTEEINYI